MTRHKIAILIGSLRRDSMNRKVGSSIRAFASDMLDCNVVEIGDLPLYNQDFDAHSPDEFLRFRRQIAVVDGILFCTPEYNRGVPGVLKNAIDMAHGLMARASGTRSPLPSLALHRVALEPSAQATSFVRRVFSSTCP